MVSAPLKFLYQNIPQTRGLVKKCDGKWLTLKNIMTTY